MTVIKLETTFTLDVVKAIPMGHVSDSDLVFYVDGKYLEIEGNGQVSIKPVTGLQLRLIESNDCMEVVFDDNLSATDLMFDSEEQEREHIKIHKHITPSFIYESMNITNPYMDETGRFKVDPKKYYGLTDNELKVFNK